MDLRELSPKEIFELQNNYLCGTRVIEIKYIPQDTSDSSVEAKYSKISAAFMNMARELHSIGKNSESFFDIMWISEPAINQVHKSIIRFFIVIRNIGKDHHSLSRNILIFQSIITKTLKSYNYPFELIDITNSDFQKLIGDIPSKSYSIVKEDIVIQTPIGITEFYYSTSIFNNNEYMGVEDLVRNLVNYPNSAIVFQVKPTNYLYEEINSITEAFYLLSRLSNGFIDDYYGEIQDSTAAQPLEVFQYYHHRINDPKFLFNISVFSSERTVIPLATAITSFLQSSASQKNTNLKIIPINANINLLDNFYTLPWAIEANNDEVRQQIPLWQYDKAPKSLFRFSRLIIDEELGNFFKLPVATTDHVSGLNIVRYGQIETYYENQVFDSENIRLGELVGSNADGKQIGLPLSDISKHLFVSGATRSGKTTAVFNLLSQIREKGIPFLVLEMVRTEYRSLMDTIDDLKIFTPGNPSISPFIINPFIPPKNVSLLQYKSSLMTAFKASFEMSGPLQALFIEAINKCYTVHGWRDNNTIEDSNIKLFGIFEFVNVFKEIMKAKKYSSEIRNNIEQAGVVRLMNLINQNYNIFDNQHSIPIEDLLSGSTIIELDAIANLEQKALIASLILVNIIAYIKATNSDKTGMLNQVLVLEEAHVLLEPRNSTGEEEQASNVAHELVSGILAEMAAYGLGLIISDQSPQKMPINVIINTGTKIILRTNEAKDKEIIAQSTNMDQEDQRLLSTFRKGMGFCFFDRVDRPQLIQTPNIQAEKNLRSIIPLNEILMKNDYWEGKKELLMPYHECVHVGTCKECTTQIRTEAKFVSNSIMFKYILPNIETFDNPKVISILKKTNKLIEEFVDKQSVYYGNIRLNHCVKIQLLRELELETEISMPQITRLKLLSNKTFIDPEL